MIQDYYFCTSVPKGGCVNSKAGEEHKTTNCVFCSEAHNAGRPSKKKRNYPKKTVPASRIPEPHSESGTSPRTSKTSTQTKRSEKHMCKDILTPEKACGIGCYAVCGNFSTCRTAGSRRSSLSKAKEKLLEQKKRKKRELHETALIENSFSKHVKI